MSKIIKIPVDKLISDVKNIMDKASERKIVLRAMGAFAVYYLVKSRNEKTCIEFYSTIGRIKPGELVLTDVDLVTYKKHKNSVEKLLKELGYKPDEYINAFFSDKRLTFHEPHGAYTIDVFFSPLEFSHTVDLENRLELHPYVLTPTDLALLKLQIHDINRKDLGDLATLLACFELSYQDSGEAVNVKRIAVILSDDWGFWYDATTNLSKLKLMLEDVKRSITGDLARLVEDTISKVDTLMKTIDETPKTGRWIKRSRIGTKKRWYNVVEEI